MKKIFFCFFTVMMAVLCIGLVSCKKDDLKEVDDQGLTEDIRDFMPEDIIQEVERLGLTIYGGNTPPDITGTYFTSPNILKDSNIDDPSDIGSLQFNDATVIFSEQDNKNLTIQVFQDHLRDESDGGSGVGGYIVGKDKNFTVFVKLLDVDTHGHEALVAMLYSGTISDAGIINLHIATIMIDDGGDPHNNLINIGGSRLIYDQDGLSERKSSTKSLLKQSENMLPGILSIQKN
ncbi:MAG: hypothetical protein LBE56_00615 [Tannerella sp.]|jgi:hypothetical protein|nr:hypothetical protein [Tannerella sp.]